MATWKKTEHSLPYLDEFPMPVEGFTDYPETLWKVDGELPYKSKFATPWVRGFTGVPKTMWALTTPMVYFDERWQEKHVDLNDYDLAFQVPIPHTHEGLPYVANKFGLRIDNSDSIAVSVTVMLYAGDTTSGLTKQQTKTLSAPARSSLSDYFVEFDSMRPQNYLVVVFSFGDAYNATLESVYSKSTFYDLSSPIPFKGTFPSMPGEPKLPPKPLTAWRHVKDELPLRPWPMLETSTIRYNEEIVEKKTIDWGRSMQQTYEYYIVNPETWQNQERIDYIISTSITHDSTSRLCGSSNMNTTEALEENYIRTYLVCNQDGHIHKECLGTYLYMTTNDSFDGVVHEYNAIGYTSLVELDENCPMLGYFIPSKDYAGRDKHVSIANNIRTIVNQHTRCELETTIEYSDMLTNDVVPAPSDTWLDIILNMIKTVAVRQYVLGADEMGNITLKVHNDINKMIPTYDYTDDDTSLLLPTLNTGLDLYKIPNVVEVIFSDSKHFFKSRAVNNDEESPISVQKRKREIVKRVVVNNIGFSEPTQKIVDAYAEKLLESESTIRQEISYTHGYCGTKVGDCVTLTYRAAGLNKVKGIITAQTINCVPGCTVDETMVYIKKLWRSNAVTSEDIKNMEKEDEDDDD